MKFNGTIEHACEQRSARNTCLPFLGTPFAYSIPDEPEAQNSSEPRGVEVQ